MTNFQENELTNDSAGAHDLMQSMFAQVDSLLAGDAAERVKDFIRFTVEQDAKAVECQPKNS